MAYRFHPRFAATALAAALLAGAVGTSIAQPAPNAPAPATANAPAPKPHKHGPRHDQRGPSPEERQARMAQRAETFKQKLQLTADQEPAWTAFTTSMRPPEGRPHARLSPEGMDKLTTPERIDRMRAMRAQHAAEMDRRDEAVKTFYAALTPAQQKVFDAEGARMHHRMGPRGDGPRADGPHGPKGPHQGPHGRPGPGPKGPQGGERPMAPPPPPAPAN